MRLIMFGTGAEFSASSITHSAALVTKLSTSNIGEYTGLRL